LHLSSLDRFELDNIERKQYIGYISLIFKFSMLPSPREEALRADQKLPLLDQSPIVLRKKVCCASVARSFALVHWV
jgi:hypothetical protein